MSLNCKKERNKVLIIVVTLVAIGAIGLIMKIKHQERLMKLSGQNIQRGLPEYFKRQMHHQKIGLELFQKHQYELAIAEYKKALDPALIKENRDQATAKSQLVTLYKLIGEYDLAIQELNFFKDWDKDHPRFVDHFENIIAEKKYAETGDKSDLLDQIEKYRNKYKNELSPQSYSIHDILKMSTLLSLYEVAKAYDEGIAYINSFLDYFYQNDPEYKPLAGRIRTVADADKCMEDNVISPGKVKPVWHNCRWLREYLLVREAYERDKRDGTVKSATRVLIESEYFGYY